MKSDPVYHTHAAGGVTLGSVDSLPTRWPHPCPAGQPHLRGRNGLARDTNNTVALGRWGGPFPLFDLEAGSCFRKYFCFILFFFLVVLTANHPYVSPTSLEAFLDSFAQRILIKSESMWGTLSLLSLRFPWPRQFTWWILRHDVYYEHDMLRTSLMPWTRCTRPLLRTRCIRRILREHEWRMLRDIYVTHTVRVNCLGRSCAADH